VSSPANVPDPSSGVAAKYRTGVSLASLIFGILAMVMSSTFRGALTFSLIAVVLGAIGWYATSRDPLRQGRYQALAGMAIGVLALVVASLSLGDDDDRGRVCTTNRVGETRCEYR
jgi:hypothetical protein